MGKVRKVSKKRRDAYTEDDISRTRAAEEQFPHYHRKSMSGAFHCVRAINFGLAGGWLTWTRPDWDPTITNN